MVFLLLWQPRRCSSLSHGLYSSCEQPIHACRHVMFTSHQATQMRCQQTVYFRNKKNLINLAHLCKWVMSLHLPLLFFKYVLVEVLFFLPILTPCVCVCIRIHQNCMEHVVEKEFPWINRKINPIANWYFMLHQRRVTGDVYEVEAFQLCYHITGHFICSIPCMTVLISILHSAPRVCLLPKATTATTFCTVMERGGVNRLHPNLWKLCAGLKVLSHIYGYPFLAPNSSGSTDFFKSLYMFPRALLPTFNICPQGLSLRLETLKYHSRSDFGRLQAWFLNEVVLKNCSSCRSVVLS